MTSVSEVDIARLCRISERHVRVLESLFRKKNFGISRFMRKCFTSDCNVCTDLRYFMRAFIHSTRTRRTCIEVFRASYREGRYITLTMPCRGP